MFILYDHVKTAWCSGKSPNNHNFSRKKLTNCNLIVLSTVTSVSKHSSLSMVYTEHDICKTSFILLITFHFRCFLFTIKKTTFLILLSRLPHTFYKYILWSLLRKPLYRKELFKLKTLLKVYKLNLHCLETNLVEVTPIKRPN